MTCIEKVFPDCFERFVMPSGAKEESIRVFRACKSGRCDKSSFLPTFEELNISFSSENIAKRKDVDYSDPQLYSLSTYELPKDIRRFASMTNEYEQPYVIAQGHTDPKFGICIRTKDYLPKKHSSHVDWWLYKDAYPYSVFEPIENFEDFLRNYEP